MVGPDVPCLAGSNRYLVQSGTVSRLGDGEYKDGSHILRPRSPITVDALRKRADPPPRLPAPGYDDRWIREPYEPLTPRPLWRDACDGPAVGSPRVANNTVDVPEV